MVTDITSIGLVEDEDIQLDLAALALSALDHQGTDLIPYLSLLKEIGARLQAVGADADTADEQVEALVAVIVHEFGFMGDAATYDAPLNADMIRVLDRRKGLPVSLAILYVAAARRMGWTAQALNTPGHVLVSMGERPAILIDPFNSGAVVAPEHLALLLSRALGPHTTASAQHVAPMSNRAVLVRLLLNQSLRAEQQGDKERAMVLYRRMTLIAPDNGHGWWELARLQLAARDIDAARRSLSAMLEVTRDPERREHVSAALDAIAPR